MAPCLKDSSSTTVFSSCFFFLKCCSISFPIFAILNQAIHVDIILMLFTLQSCVKPIHINNNTNSSPSAPAHFLSETDRKCAGAEGEELVLSLQPCRENLLISIMKHGSILYFSISKPKVIHQFHVFFYVPSVTCICKPPFSSKDLSVLMVLAAVFILIYPHWFLLYPFYKVCRHCVVLFTHSAHTHTHRFQRLS